MVKYVKFLGIPMPVLSDEEMSEQVARHNAEDGAPPAYMVIRVADADPRDGSPELRTRRRRTPCETCGEICWIDPKGYEPTGGAVRIMCVQCVHAAVKEQS